MPLELEGHVDLGGPNSGSDDDHGQEKHAGWLSMLVLRRGICRYRHLACHDTLVPLGGARPRPGGLRGRCWILMLASPRSKTPFCDDVFYVNCQILEVPGLLSTSPQIRQQRHKARG
ncbi:hypothetical protein DPMN_190601 [Dreissena polymorpha]|uniref:Uncharacterized protein n=1 Tax=Dreissena polymorpha TaxID=45954 RepID=A0A9D3Y0Q8_DREPO|nr:hypothetical protein DPMN_190601 [Dreissena polymorpha]